MKIKWKVYIIDEITNNEMRTFKLLRKFITKSKIYMKVYLEINGGIYNPEEQEFDIIINELSE